MSTSPSFLSQIGSYPEKSRYIYPIETSNLSDDVKKSLLDKIQGELTPNNILFFMAFLNEIQEKLSAAKTRETQLMNQLLQEEDELKQFHLPEDLFSEGEKTINNILEGYSSHLHETGTTQQLDAFSRFEKE
jgi:hypothetical protein